jgi:hypothetical protein
MEPSLSQLSLGYVPAQILYATAELGIADAFADGPRGYESLAKQTGTDPSALRRLLRALAGLGLVTQVDADRFALTDLGRRLRADVPGSSRDDVMLSTAPELWRAWGELSRVVRTGEPARDPGTGMTAHESMLRNAELSAMLHAGKARSSLEFTAGVIARYDFSRFRTIVDLGGDDGALITAVLVAVPDLRGMLVDLPGALAEATARLDAAGVADRCGVIAGDITRSVPGGADAYLLNNIIREWGDDRAIALLRTCRAAMSPTARLLLMETVMPAVLSPGESAAYGLTDLNNLVFTGGRERTRDEYGEVLDAAGFTVTEVVTVPVTSGMPDCHLIEGALAG